MPPRGARGAAPGQSVRLIDRQTFLSRVWRYRGGEHVSFIGPTGSGKTHLALQLLARSASEELPAYVTVMKARDKTLNVFLGSHERWKRLLNYPPPPVLPGATRPVGYLVWPVHTNDPEGDDQRHEQIFHRMHRQLYVKGNNIIFDDEVVSLVREMGMKPDLTRIWTKGRSIGSGLWAATQRPAMVPLEMYDQAQHLFLGNIKDKRSQDRFGEISGVDPELVVAVVRKLPKFHWLYVRQEEGTMCVVGP
jgi:energy-coupling factor transporter ATP-binding protein EcfA2